MSEINEIITRVIDAMLPLAKCNQEPYLSSFKSQLEKGYVLSEKQMITLEDCAKSIAPTLKIQQVYLKMADEFINSDAAQLILNFSKENGMSTTV